MDGNLVVYDKKILLKRVQHGERLCLRRFPNVDSSPFVWKKEKMRVLLDTFLKHIDGSSDLTLRNLFFCYKINRNRGLTNPFV